MTSASSGPRLQSVDDTGDKGAAVGGDGAGVSLDDISVGVDVGPSAGGVLVLVASWGGADGVDGLQLADKIEIRINKGSSSALGCLIVFINWRFSTSAAFFPRNLALIRPSNYYRTTQWG